MDIGHFQPLVACLHAAPDVVEPGAKAVDRQPRRLVVLKEGIGVMAQRPHGALAQQVNQRELLAHRVGIGQGLLAMFARLGEQTGQLPQMLDRAARQLNGEVQRRALALATILEPLLIVVMGVVVMLIVLAVLLPIIQLNTWVK